MRVEKGVYLIFLIAVMGLVGCSTPVRFSQDEIKGYPLDVQERITKGEVSPGMTPQQVRYAWGNPDAIKSLEPENGKAKEEWVYSSVAGALKTRLIFVDGKLTYIISTEPGRMK